MTATGLDLLGLGKPIILTDGTEVQLRYSFRALALLEARFGSVAAVQASIDSTGEGAAFGPLLQMIGAGCVGPGGFEPHLREHVAADGTRTVSHIVYRRRTDLADLADLLHPGRLGEYASAFGAALSAALESPGNGAAGPITIEEVRIPDSPGTTSTTSPSVPSTFLPSPSGT
ncbi:hypothetical protein [Streptomyces sp. RKAG337]|uniref:hypothetical protein n=1 Tax=Streptomyces sp. RKAG337 TaxID=2893404 RepID=UPI0020349E12|nr:hypothetical protein [Streptomyces sp. RKAG337]MCM2427387.1 hypothetical protein [Streptomyces sp. RKAG337]